MVVATGFFDGVHTGHRLVIEKLVDAAGQRGDESLVVTFWPHPRNVLQQEAYSLRLLTTLDFHTGVQFPDQKGVSGTVCREEVRRQGCGARV